MNVLDSFVVLPVGGLFLLSTPMDCGGRATDACAFPAGAYVTHFTRSGFAPECPNLPDRTMTIEADGTIAGGSGAQDGGWGEVNVSSTCTTTWVTDTGTPSGIRTIATTTITLRAGSLSGKETIDSTDPRVSHGCTYDMTLTRSGP